MLKSRVMTHLFMYAIVPILLVLICSIPAVHTTVSVDQYDIEVGWGIEPPIVGLRNDFVIHISEPGDVKGVSSGVCPAIFGGMLVLNLDGH